MADDTKWLTVKEAAARAKLSQWSIYQACERNEIRHIRVGGRRAIRLTPEALDSWLVRHERGPSAVETGDPQRMTVGGQPGGCL